MKKNLQFLVISAIVGLMLSLPSQAFAAKIVFKKGKTVEAKIIQIGEKDIKVDLKGVELTYALDEIKNINGMPGMNRAKLDEIEKEGHEYVEQKEYTKAVNTLKKITELDPSNALVFSDIGRALEKLKRHSESLPYILREIELNPNEPWGYMRLGNVYRHDTDPGAVLRAVAAYEKAGKLQGPTVSNQCALGSVYFKFGQRAKALPYLERCVAMEPDNKEIEFKQVKYMNLGMCYLFLGKYQEAIPIFQTVIEKVPVADQGKAYYGLSLAYECLGQPAKAAEYKRQAEKIGYRDRPFYFKMSDKNKNQS